MIHLRSPAYYLSLLARILDELEDYLLSTSLFWPLSGRPPPGEPRFPRLTPGTLLLTSDALEAQSPDLSTQETEDYRRLRQTMWVLLEDHRSLLGRKAVEEMNQRLTLWRTYLGDLFEEGRNVSEYPQQVRNRVIYERLFDLLIYESEAEEHRDNISALDASLRLIFQSGSFLWDSRLESVYPPESYWFLSGLPHF